MSLCVYTNTKYTHAYANTHHTHIHTRTQTHIIARNRFNNYYFCLFFLIPNVIIYLCKQSLACTFLICIYVYIYIYITLLVSSHLFICTNIDLRLIHAHTFPIHTYPTYLHICTYTHTHTDVQKCVKVDEEIRCAIKFNLMCTETWSFNKQRIFF